VIERRLRIVGFRVMPVCYLDDGENLEPFPVAAIEVPASLWQEFADTGLEAALAQLRASVSGVSPAEVPRDDDAD
jgi:hypothetical protein